MTDLIADLERGPGSRELSDEVLLALGWHFVGDAKDPRTTYWATPNGDQTFDLWDDPHARSRTPILHRPSPTESVDDALALVPEGVANRMFVYPEKTTAAAGVGGSTLELPKRLIAAFGDNPLPRAICLAVLQSV